MTKILVIQQKMIGDVLTTSILFELLREKYPDAQLDYLINTHTHPVVENNPFVDNFIFFTKEAETSKKVLLELGKNVKKNNYDIVIDVYSKLSSNIITLLSGAKTKISYYKHYSAFVYHYNIKRLKKTEAKSGLAIANRLQLLKPLNIEATETKPKIYLTQNEIDNSKLFLIDNAIDFDKPLFMISVLGSGETKTYPFPFMANIIDTIVEETKGQLLFNYIPNQEAEAKEIFNLCKPETRKHILFDVFGKNLREFLAITKHCDALIGNEGGAINMAKALNLKTFAIFSPWIDKATWNLFEDDKTHVSVHLNDFKPGLFKNKTPKVLKKEIVDLYKIFIPDLFNDQLINFLNNKITLQKKPKISAVIITYNEVIHIDSLIKNLDFIDEIVVLDSFSTDGTFEKLSSYNQVKTYQRKFTNFANQKNYALSKASNDWVLFIDADERVNPKGKQEIIEAVNNDSFVAYWAKFQYYFDNIAINYSGFQTARSVRLFRKSKCNYDELKIVHEKLLIKGNSGELTNKLDHYSFRNYEHYKHKMQHYAKLKATYLFNKNKKSNSLVKYLKACYRFFNHYIIRLGILDGKIGYQISYLNAYGVVLRYNYLKEMRSKISKT